MQRRRIGSVLIANRGEIAERVIRTLRRLGIRTVAVYSYVDRDLPYISAADSSFLLSNPQLSSASSDTYLQQEMILDIARRSHVDAIHPGYGFLSENPSFAARCEAAGFIFIGPQPASITAMGSKSGAKQLLSSPPYAGKVPLIPGYNGADQSLETLEKQALNVGFPLLIKAAAGGGGKGMRIVHDPAEVATELASAKREAKAAFGDDTVLLERYFDTVKHIEIQIFGDSHGNVIHLFERDCSVQRRYQKIIEETPSPVLNDSLRNAIAEAAVTIGKAINYRGAGTVEFIFDQKEKKFYFLEVNTRLQVEHPITECITGLDLVELQLRVAEGFSLAELGVTQSSVTRTGHAIECRLYCEDPTTEQFLPSVGLLEWFKLPQAIPGARYDTGVRSGSEISMFYDPMVGKIICHAPDRSSAISKMIRILSEMVVYGPSLKTNQQFLIDLLRHPLFAQGIYTTHLIKDHIPLDSRLQLAKEQRQRYNAERVSAVVSTLLLWHLRRQGQTLLKHVQPGYHNNPPAVASRRPFQLLSMSDHEHPVRVDYTYLKPTHFEVQRQYVSSTQTNTFAVSVFGAELQASLSVEEGALTTNDHGNHMGRVAAVVDGVHRVFDVLVSPTQVFVHSTELGSHLLRILPRLASAADNDREEKGNGVYKASMAGKVARVAVQPGVAVKVGSLLFVMESMKMETKILAQEEGTVASVAVKEGQIVQDGELLLVVTPSAPAAK